MILLQPTTGLRPGVKFFAGRFLLLPDFLLLGTRTRRAGDAEMMQPATLTASTCIIRSLDPANYFATAIIFYWKQLQILLSPCSVLAGSSFCFCFHHGGGRRQRLRPAATTTTSREGGYRRAHRGGTFWLGASLIHGSMLEVFFKGRRRLVKEKERIVRL